MRLSQLTQMIGLLTEIRDCLVASRVDQRVSAIQIIETMNERDRERRERQPRSPTPRPPLPTTTPPHYPILLPEELVEQSRGRYPAFPIRQQKSQSGIPRPSREL